MNNFKYILLNLLVFSVFSMLLYRLFIVSTSDYVDGHDLREIEKSVKSKTDVLYSERGKILDSDGNILAESVSTYNIIAFVNPKRSEGATKQAHVSDVDKTASVIANVVGEDVNLIKDTLNNSIKNGNYQTYLGRRSSNISASQKAKIEEHNLPGIEFEEKKSRAYPYGDFASYQVGYAKYYEDNDGVGKLVGELGVEKSFDKELEGEDGFHEYISDARGVQIPNTEETISSEINGNDVYLTIEKDVQLIVESAVKEIDEKYKPEVVLLVVADAKSGKILGVSSTPSFDPNIRDVESYINPLHEQTIEPGSTMKTFTYASAIEDGVYDGSKLYKSGTYSLYDSKIRDWNKFGFGTISLETGYMKSSNVGSAILGYEILGEDKLVHYLEQLGFGSKTGFDLPGEVAGDIEIKNPVDAVTTTFGQGMTVTPIQMIQALTVFGTDGSVMRPYIVEKIVDSHGNLVRKTEPQVNNLNVYSKETVSQMKDLMELYVSGPEAIHHKYSFPDYGLIGKTGTAQIANSRGEYLVGDNNHFFSFTGLMPKDDPEIIIYAGVKRPTKGDSDHVNNLVKKVVPSIAELYDISTKDTTEVAISSTVIMLDYANLTKDEAYNLKNQNSDIDTVIIGNGNKVLAQYPKAGTTLQTHSRAYLKLDGDVTMIDLTGYTYRDVAIIANLLGLKVNATGVGNVVNQSIPANTILTTESEISVELK